MAGKPAKAPIGGINWGVGAYTKHPQEAFAAAACMRNEENEKEAAIKGGLPPTLESLYSDRELIKAYPFAGLIRRQLLSAAVRPRDPGVRRRVAGDRQGGVAADADPDQRLCRPLRGTLKDALELEGHCYERDDRSRGPARTGRAPKRETDRAKAERKLAWLLCAPAVFVMLAVTAYPIIYAFYLSLLRADLRFPNDRTWIGLHNYETVLSSRCGGATCGTPR